MIHFSLRLIIPFIKGRFINLFHKTGKLTRNKSWEIECCYYSKTLLEIDFNLQFRENDHAGINLILCLFGYSVNIMSMDNRHWDFDNNCWKK